MRTAPVGLRRRRVGIVHHGTAVRQRTPDLASAVDALAAILADMATRTGQARGHGAAPGLPAGQPRRAGRRVCRRPTSTIGHSRKRGIAEVPTWQATVDPATGRVRCGSDRGRLAGVVIATPLAGPTFDDARRYLWSLADGDRRGWAALLDRLDESVVVRSDDAASGIRRLLG